jgi:alanine racemase
MLLSCGFTAVIDSLKTARLLAGVCAKYQRPLNVRLKVNTGMNRYGMNVQALGKTCKFLQSNPFLKVLAIDSHLCECTIVRAEKQRRCFEGMLAVCKRYFPTINAYLGATYGALLGEKYHYDGVRIGLGLYGYLPCEANEKTGISVTTVEKLALRKSMQIYAKAVGNRSYQFGSVGYGEELHQSPKRLTVYRVGYADGFLRKRENGVEGWQNNAGVLCMDACIRDGTQPRGRYIPIMTDAESVAKITDTATYEVLCAATRRAEFIYDEETAFRGR